MHIKKYECSTGFATILVVLCCVCVSVCVHKSLLNAFPRSDLVRGNVVTHLICGPSAWLSLEWPHLTPPAGSITDPHLSHFLSATYTPPSSPVSLCLDPSLPFSISTTAGLQGDSRSRGQQKSVPTPDSVEVKNKRRPGRPRKHPLPSTLSSPTHSSAAPPMSSPDLLPEYSHSRDGREVGGRREERGPERDRGGNDTVQQVTESELQAKRKRGRKRKHGDSPCHQR